MFNLLSSKRKRLFIFLIFLSAVSIVFLIYISKNKGVVETTTQVETNEIATFNSIKPGSNFDTDKINALLGYPTSSVTDNELTVNEYRSSNEYRFNQIEIKDGKIDLIKEVVNPNDNKNDEDIRSIYGVSDYVLYEKQAYSYFNLFVYLKKGIAYLGHDDGTVIEIWYFEPTNIDNFMEKYAPNYQETPFEGQSSH